MSSRALVEGRTYAASFCRSGTQVGRSYRSTHGKSEMQRSSVSGMTCLKVEGSLERGRLRRGNRAGGAGALALVNT
jgi:hypothetical protein